MRRGACQADFPADLFPSRPAGPQPSDLRVDRLEPRGPTERLFHAADRGSRRRRQAHRLRRRLSCSTGQFAQLIEGEIKPTRWCFCAPPFRRRSYDCFSPARHQAAAFCRAYLPTTETVSSTYRPTEAVMQPPPDGEWHDGTRQRIGTGGAPHEQSRSREED